VSRPIQFTLNGRPATVDADPERPLLDILRNTLGLKATRLGCAQGQCGACTVLVGERALTSCDLPLSAVAGREVTTLEGLGSSAKPSPIQQAFIDEQAAQCGYCSNGMVVAATALLQANPNPSEQQVREALDANLCRCGVHNRVVRAVLRAAA
jgi:nicotinate dehydrogenase subunit A